MNVKLLNLYLVECLFKLKTPQRRKTFSSKKFLFDSSEERFISNIERPSRNHYGQYIPKTIAQTFQYISLRRTLSGLFSYLSLIFSDKKSTDGFIHCHRDTVLFENDVFLKKFPNAIRFLISGFFSMLKWEIH